MTNLHFDLIKNVHPLIFNYFIIIIKYQFFLSHLLTEIFRFIFF
jgi:hypothetical protein